MGASLLAFALIAPGAASAQDVLSLGTPKARVEVRDPLGTWRMSSGTPARAERVGARGGPRRVDLAVHFEVSATKPCAEHIRSLLPASVSSYPIQPAFAPKNWTSEMQGYRSVSGARHLYTLMCASVNNGSITAVISSPEAFAERAGWMSEPNYAGLASLLDDVLTAHRRASRGSNQVAKSTRSGSSGSSGKRRRRGGGGTASYDSLVAVGGFGMIATEPARWNQTPWVGGVEARLTHFGESSRKRAGLDVDIAAGFAPRDSPGLSGYFRGVMRGGVFSEPLGPVRLGIAAGLGVEALSRQAIPTALLISSQAHIVFSMGEAAALHLTPGLDLGVGRIQRSPLFEGGTFSGEPHADLRLYLRAKRVKGGTYSAVQAGVRYARMMDTNRFMVVFGWGMMGER